MILGEGGEMLLERQSAQMYDGTAGNLANHSHYDILQVPRIGLLSVTSGLDILATILAVPYFGPAD